MKRANRRRGWLVAAATLLVATAGALGAHDLFLKLDDYFLVPHTDIAIPLLNGTFDMSENVISRDRMLDVSVVGPLDQRAHPETSSWWERGDTTFLNLRTGDAGTYIVGVSTNPTVFELTGEQFDGYLEHDGVVDMLEKRKAEGTFGTPAVEKYAKHVKAILQVGTDRSAGYLERLGYPIEIVPLENPYTLRAGDTFEALVLRDGVPVPELPVYASYDGHQGHDPEGENQAAVTTRTDAFGVVRFRLSHSGRWYVRLIHMVESEEEGVDYESQWATLTFQIP